MKTRLAIVCFIAVLGWPVLARAQDNDDWPPLSYLRSDYRRVVVVAHVRVREAEIVKTIGGYEDWHCVGEVIEPFKGKFHAGQTLEFYHGAEKGFRKELFLGDKIVFLFRNYVQAEKRWVYAVLENSTLPYTEDRVRKLRLIRNSTRKPKIKRTKFAGAPVAPTVRRARETASRYPNIRRPKWLDATGKRLLCSLCSLSVPSLL